MNRLLLICAAPLVLAGCGSRSGDNPNPFKNGSTVVYFTSTCTAKANDECVQYTCKQDDKSDCSGFANGCVKGGNHYAGTQEGGKCTKVL